MAYSSRGRDAGPRAPRVLVFDSGVGGLSVLAEIARRLPGVELAFTGDNRHFPYGTKPAEMLLPQIEASVRRAVAACTPDLLVVACNTASTFALPHLRTILPMPVVGVVPAIKPAAALSATKVIGLLATPATVDRPYTSDLISRFAPDCTVIRVGSADLVTLAEAALRGIAPARDRLAAILDPFFAGPDGVRLDVIVLACTHFPLLRDALAQAAPRPVTFLDSGEAIARRVESLLGIDGMTAAIVRRHRAYFTAPADDLAGLGPAFDRLGLEGPIVLQP